MRYCSNLACSNPNNYYMETEGGFCSSCGTELTPYIQCLCGKQSFNPKFLPKFCTGCGVAVTPTHLGQCMKAQLHEIVQQVSQKLSVAEQIRLN